LSNIFFFLHSTFFVSLFILIKFGCAKRLPLPSVGIICYINVRLPGASRARSNTLCRQGSRCAERARPRRHRPAGESRTGDRANKTGWPPATQPKQAGKAACVWPEVTRFAGILIGRAGKSRRMGHVNYSRIIPKMRTNEYWFLLGRRKIS